MFSIIGIRIKAELGLNETEFGLLVEVAPQIWTAL
jgi:hypothetical protein